MSKILKEKVFLHCSGLKCKIEQNISNDLYNLCNKSAVHWPYWPKHVTKYNDFSVSFARLDMCDAHDNLHDSNSQESKPQLSWCIYVECLFSGWWWWCHIIMWKCTFFKTKKSRKFTKYTWRKSRFYLHSFKEFDGKMNLEEVYCGHLWTHMTSICKHVITFSHSGNVNFLLQHLHCWRPIWLMN